MRCIALVFLALFCLVAARPAHAQANPAARCAKLGTDSTLLPVPESLAAQVNAVFGTAMPPGMVAATTVYRCAQGHVLVCTTGANLPCGPANTSRVPGEGAVAWCKQNPDSDYVPAYATGHDTIFIWRCRKGVAEVEKQVFEVDAQGFVKRFWKALPG